MIETGGGRYDPAEDFVYFIAGVLLGDQSHPYTLMAVNEMGSDTAVADFERRLEVGKVFLDSGVFWLTQRHARSRGVHMDDALGLHPDEIDGFDWLYDTYVQVAKRYEDRLWGYVELDQGGADRKRETRARLEAEGLRPIPVYHPINDGWEYFDELASGYDRICVGNLVNAMPPTRKRILATLWERRREYPDLWIHLLGYTPSQWTVAYPSANSCDSSSWAYLIRYGAPSAPGGHAMTASFSRFTHGFSPVPANQGGEQSSTLRGIEFLVSEAHFTNVSWRRQWHDLDALFQEGTPWPPRNPREGPIREHDMGDAQVHREASLAGRSTEQGLPGD